MEAEPLRLLTRDSHMAVGVAGPLFVVVTLQPPSKASVLRFRACLLAHRRTVGVPLLGVVVPNAPRPRLNAEGRQAILDLWQELSQQLLGCAVWIRRDSFIGAAQRSLVTGLLMVRRPAIVADVVANAADAIAVLQRASPEVSPVHARQWTSALDQFAADHTP